jgi:hypothetical protein
MSEIIPLSAEPNQEVVVVLGGVRHTLTVKEAGGVMVVTIMRGSQVLISSVRACAGTPLLPYRHMEDDFGNFIFISPDDDLIPYWTDFETGTQLVWTSAAELAQVRSGLA